MSSWTLFELYSIRNKFYYRGACDREASCSKGLLVDSSDIVFAENYGTLVEDMVKDQFA